MSPWFLLNFGTRCVASAVHDAKSVIGAAEIVILRGVYTIVKSLCCD